MPRLPPFAFLLCYSLEQCLVKFAQFHTLGVFELMSVAGLLAALCIYMTYAFGLSLYFLLFVLLLFPLPPSLGCRLPSQTVALQSVAGGVPGRLGRGKYFSSAGLKLSFLGSRPAGCSGSRQACLEAVFLLYRFVVP